MKVRLEVGPRFGQFAHVPASPLVELLIALGFISIAPNVTEQPAPAFPSRGWVIGKLGLELKPCLIYNDGCGGTTRCLAIPSSFGHLPSPPAELLEHFRALVGNPEAEREAAARQRREADKAAAQAKTGMRIL
jgi:hypothetical protein